MSLLTIVVVSAVILIVAYVSYGRLLLGLLRLDPKARTPAVEMRDDVDYVPIEPKFLLSQHFSAIAAAGPIVGPIVAGVMFGWLPALLWILIGSIFIGGVHDLTALVASIRHKARSIAEVVRDHMSRRAYMLFLAFVWLSLVYIIVAFTDVTAGSFLGMVSWKTARRPNFRRRNGHFVVALSRTADRDGTAVAIHKPDSGLGDGHFLAAGGTGHLGRTEDSVRPSNSSSDWRR